MIQSGGDLRVHRHVNRCVSVTDCHLLRQSVISQAEDHLRAMKFQYEYSKWYSIIPHTLY